MRNRDGYAIKAEGGGYCIVCKNKTDVLYINNCSKEWKCIVCVQPIQYDWNEHFSRVTWNHIEKISGSMSILSAIAFILVFPIDFILHALHIGLWLAWGGETSAFFILFIIFTGVWLTVSGHGGLGYVTDDERQKIKERKEVAERKRLEKSYRITWMQASEKERELLSEKIDKEIKELIYG